MKFTWKPPPPAREEQCWCADATLPGGERIEITVMRHRGGWLAAFRRSNLDWVKIPEASQTATGVNRDAAATLLLDKLERERPLVPIKEPDLDSTTAS